MLDKGGFSRDDEYTSGLPASIWPVGLPKLVVFFISNHPKGA
jgi:hypothetical protein